MSDQGTGDQGTPGDSSKGDDKANDKANNQPAIRDGMTAAEVQDLLKAERDRQDMKLKGTTEQTLADARAAWEAEAKTAQERAAMDATQRAEAEKKEAVDEAARLKVELADSKAQGVRAMFVAQNAAGLDVAWRGYLDGQLAARDEGTSMEDVLARVTEEHQQASGRSGAPLGVPGRPGGQQRAAGENDTMNDALKRAAGRR